MTPYLHPRDLLLIKLNLSGMLDSPVDKSKGFSEGTGFLLFATQNKWYKYSKNLDKVATWRIATFKDLDGFYLHVM